MSDSQSLESQTTSYLPWSQSQLQVHDHAGSFMISETESQTLTESQPQTPQSQTQTNKPKRVHYTPELKLQLIRLCINNGERYLEPGSEIPFWQYISALFKDITGQQGADVRKKVQSMVGDRKASIEAQKTLSGVAIAPITDLEQAINSWIKLINRRVETRQEIKSKASQEVKQEKENAEVRRGNMRKRLAKKREFQAVVEAREIVDLEAPGDTIQKRRQIRRHLRDVSDNSEENKGDFHRLTESLLEYMSTPKPKIAATATTTQNTTKPHDSQPEQSLASIASEVAGLKSQMGRLEALLEGLVSSKSKNTRESTEEE